MSAIKDRKLITLKTCPFDGAQARFGLEVTTFTTTGRRWYYVMCTKCDCVTGTRASPANAAKLWNRRTSQVTSNA